MFLAEEGMYHKKEITQERIHEFASRNKIEYRAQPFEM